MDKPVQTKGANKRPSRASTTAGKRVNLDKGKASKLGQSPTTMNSPVSGRRERERERERSDGKDKIADGDEGKTRR